MRAARTRSLAGRTAVAALTLLGVGAAQDDESSAPQASQSEATQPGGTTQPVELQGTEEVKLTPAQMKKRAAAILENAAKASDQVRQMLKKARDEKDIVKVVCVGDKEMQLGTAGDTLKDRNEAMLEAFERGNVARGRHEYTLIVVLGERVLILVSEANQCIGEETGFAGESALVLEIDPSLPNPDPSLIPFLPLVAIEPSVQSPID